MREFAQLQSQTITKIMPWNVSFQYSLCHFYIQSQSPLDQAISSRAQIQRDSKQKVITNYYFTIVLQFMQHFMMQTN